ncbi:hypothetical protein BROUX41_004330 [Berkeleyomyces rouxiae]|uniref:uncharacterized protein n=1 Tax=Berkeleyomyces rouxiae TaxID=2035830 RepID=UPI003B81A49C
MYQNPAGFFPGAPSSSPGGFNPQQHPQNPQIQPGGQPGNTMMFNPQQFQNMGGQNFMPGNPAMMGAQGGMMQNPGMQPMAANGQPRFPNTQFQGQPFPASTPSPSNTQQPFNQNFMMGNSIGFPGGNPQIQGQSPAMQQRHGMPQNAMPGQMNMGTPQRPVSVASQGTPTPMQKSQFAAPPTQPQATMQPPTTQPNANITTPQTPTFPSFAGPTPAGQPAASPVSHSPRSEALQKERFSVLLDINQELLYEAIQLQYTLAEAKKEGDKVLEEEASKDNNQCLRRLSSNLQYLAGLADPKLKGLPRPSLLTPPPLNLNLRLRISPFGIDGENAPSIDAVGERMERDKLIRELYSKLQACFPGMDPSKEIAFNNTRAPGGQPHGTPQSQAQPHLHQQGQNQGQSQHQPQPLQQNPKVVNKPPVQHQQHPNKPPTPQPSGQAPHHAPQGQPTPQQQAKQLPGQQQPQAQHQQMRNMNQQPQLPPQQMMPQQLSAQQRQMMAIQQQMAHMGAMNPMGQVPHTQMGHMPQMGHQMGHMPMNTMPMGQMPMGQMQGMAPMNSMQHQMPPQMHMGQMGMMGGGMGQFEHMGQMNPMQMGSMGGMGQIPGPSSMQQRPPMPGQGGGGSGMS